MPDMRIYNFQKPRTTRTDGLKKSLFQAVDEVRKGPPLWKLGKLDQLLTNRDPSVNDSKKYKLKKANLQSSEMR